MGAVQSRQKVLGRPLEQVVAAMSDYQLDAAIEAAIHGDAEAVELRLERTATTLANAVSKAAKPRLRGVAKESMNLRRRMGTTASRRLGGQMGKAASPWGRFSTNGRRRRAK